MSVLDASEESVCSMANITHQPAFLRASHSPWRFIPQNILVILRGVVLAYLVALGVMGSNYKLGLESENPVWRFLFDFSVISYVFVAVYHIITFVGSPPEL
jgi:hypothetical protein